MNPTKKPRISEHCAACLYRKETLATDNQEYLREVRNVIDNRRPEDTPPYMVLRFNQLHEKYFGAAPSYKEIKKKYNSLVLSMEESLRTKIQEAEDPVMQAFAYARIGNFIDFGAFDNIDDEEFLALFDKASLSERDKVTAESFLSQCEKGNNFLLVTDNCGEIVLDKLFIEELKKRFPHLTVYVMVRGGEAINDATLEDALDVGMDQVASVIDNGKPISGTIYEMLPEDVQKIFDEADVILTKGQGNYESLNGQGFHIFYSFLCKCDYFMNKFQVPRLTGMFVEE